jgi:hypothetical protein
VSRSIVDAGSVIRSQGEKATALRAQVVPFTYATMGTVSATRNMLDAFLQTLGNRQLDADSVISPALRELRLLVMLMTNKPRTFNMGLEYEDIKITSEATADQATKRILDNAATSVCESAGIAIELLKPNDGGHNEEQKRFNQFLFGISYLHDRHMAFVKNHELGVMLRDNTLGLGATGHTYDILLR